MGSPSTFSLPSCHVVLKVTSFCRVPTELKKRIQSARLEKKLTQAQLGQLINEKPNVSVREI